jgi:hypothetical protein
MIDDITHELAETLKELRTKFDSRESLIWTMVDVDAALELYEDACKPKMTINLKDYAGKLVVATLRNELMFVGTVNTSEKYTNVPYFIDGRYYISDGRCFCPANRLHDIVDIVLADEDPEPVINRVEVITDGGRVYTNWDKNNVITTSLQDDGKTLKIFVNTEEPEMPITKPTFHIEPEVIDDLWYTAANYKKFANDIAKMMSSSTKVKVSNYWATALSNFIDELGGDSPALWEWGGITPTPEKVVECLRELVDFHMTIAADNELDECVDWVSKYCPYLGDFPMPEVKLRDARRPKPTLKSQALKDFETVRKHSDLLPEILDTIENALKSIPE